MPLNTCLENIRRFLFAPTKETSEAIFRVTVVAFEDKCNLNCGRRFAEILKHNPLFEVNFFDEAFPKGFLNLQGRNFFDFIDRGNKILSSTHSDVLVWGYEENGKIRLNFQTADPYIVPNDELSYSLLDSLYIPLSFLTSAGSFSESVLLVICGIIIASIRPITEDQINNKPLLLKSIIELLASDTSPKDISREFMPYIMNMLGKIYLSNTQHQLSPDDIEIIRKLFETALKDKYLITQPVQYGCVCHNMAQLYECAYNLKPQQLYEYLKTAIACYQEAHKYLNKNYPYDFGLIAYHLAVLYFEFWKQTNDLQALRDAVSQLREAEKVYTETQFPKSWCVVEGLLGYYLTSLGMNVKSNDIMQLAINGFRNQQRIFEQRIYPMQWAGIQEEIGHIYYLLGKQNEDENFMLEARNYFKSALDVYSQLKAKPAITETERRLAKIRNYID
ncbi:MAG: hypothetical protein IJ218_03765 [Alphaproteobacteria bacterium]|nr:hypothetical protein [Alphaproteobacteria bacterium]